MGKAVEHECVDGNMGAFVVRWEAFAAWACTPEVRFYFFNP